MAIERRIGSAVLGIPDNAALHQEVKAWQECRNQDAVHVNWRFTTEDARFKLKSLYPSIQTC